MTTTPQRLYPFIQHSFNVYCEPNIKSGCVPALPDLNGDTQKVMFPECCFCTLLTPAPSLMSRREPLGQGEIQVLTNLAHTWPSTTCPCSICCCSAPPLSCSSNAPLWFLPSWALLALCLLHPSPPPALSILPCLFTGSTRPQPLPLDLRVTSPKSLT